VERKRKRHRGVPRSQQERVAKREREDCRGRERQSVSHDLVTPHTLHSTPL
jgi:K+-sensing histidine kinase KdpD